MLLRQIIRYFASVMKRWPYIFLYFALGIIACTGPVILEEPKDTPSDNEQNDSPLTGDSHKPDSVVIIHKGTYTSPYSIAEAQALRNTRGVWVEGYIVGIVSGSMKNGCNYSQEATTQSNILLADTFPTGNENDYQFCHPVELPNGSIEREELNLYDNPDNYHRKVRILGDITLYYSTIGIKKIADYIFTEDIEFPNEDEDKLEDEGESNEEDKDERPYDPDETRQDTLTIAEGIALQSDREYHQVYIKGYIIGYTTSSQKIYYDLADIKKTAKTNVVLADNIEEQDCDNMIAIELKEGTYIQQAVNLIDNPQNLHKSLTVKGAMKEYKSLYGCIDIPNGLKEGNDTIKDYYFFLE